MFFGTFPGESHLSRCIADRGDCADGGYIAVRKKRHPGTEVTLAHFDIRFLRPVVPGDQLIIEVNAIKVMKTGAFVGSEVTVAGVMVARGKLTLKINNKKNKKEPDIDE